MMEQASEDETESDANETDQPVETTEAPSEPVSQEAGLREYFLLDGDVSMMLSEEKYDVFQSDNMDNQLALSRQGLSQEKVDSYM